MYFLVTSTTVIIDLDKSIAQLLFEDHRGFTVKGQKRQNRSSYLEFPIKAILSMPAFEFDRFNFYGARVKNTGASRTFDGHICFEHAVDFRMARNSLKIVSPG